MESLEQRGDSGWSVVMAGFSGDWWAFKRASEIVFGRDDLDAYRLCVDAELHLPSELVSGVSVQEASRIADHLREAGAETLVLPSEDVPEVRHTASEIWATRCIGELCFIEADGLVVLGSSLDKRDILVNARSGLTWQVECELNHVHPADAGTPAEEAAELELDYIGRLRYALRQAYPQRRFTISHFLGDRVTFWQTTPDSPREPELENEELIFVEP